MKKKILIVEDDQFLREFYQELLTSEGYQVETASDGEEGLVKIKEGSWSLILLDIMLPKKDGLMILKELQNSSFKASGPIVVLTNLGSENIINQAFSLGASGYLVKSALNPDEVLGQVDSYLQKSPHA